jgi:DNA-binding XRE family transcriptional regulator
VGLTQIDVARNIEERAETIGAIDRGDVKYGPSFAAYLKYADFLGVTLLEVFTTPTPMPQASQEALQGVQGPKEPSKEDLMVSRGLRGY